MEKFKQEKERLKKYYQTSNFFQIINHLAHQKKVSMINKKEEIKAIESIFVNNRESIFLEKGKYYGIIYRNFVFIKYFDWSSNSKTYVMIEKNIFLNKKVYH